MKRNDEKFCRDAFDSFLSERSNTQPYFWGEILDINEPPDYLLNFHGKQYAVEVTAIVGRIHLSNKSKPSPEVFTALRYFAEKCTKEAIDKGCLKGAYVLNLMAVDEFKQATTVARPLILDYLEKTIVAKKFEEQQVFQERGRRWTIRKYGNRKNYLGYTLGQDGTWEGQISKDLESLFNSRVQDKVKKLSNVTMPKILLLLDQFFLSDENEWLSLINQPQEDFHTIARISDDGKCQILFSCESDWLDHEFS